jgi:hypothetical protein
LTCSEFAIGIPDRSANIAGLLGRFRLTVLAMPGKPPQAGLFQSSLASLADRRAAALMLVTSDPRPDLVWKVGVLGERAGQLGADLGELGCFLIDLGQALA